MTEYEVRNYGLGILRSMILLPLYTGAAQNSITCTEYQVGDVTAAAVYHIITYGQKGQQDKNTNTNSRHRTQSIERVSDAT